MGTIVETEIEAERDFNQGLASGVVPSPVAAFACSRADAIAGCGEGGLGSRSWCVCGERGAAPTPRKPPVEKEQEERDGSQPFHPEVGLCGQAQSQARDCFALADPA